MYANYTLSNRHLITIPAIFKSSSIDLNDAVKMAGMVIRCRFERNLKCNQYCNFVRGSFLLFQFERTLKKPLWLSILSALKTILNSYSWAFKICEFQFNISKLLPSVDIAGNDKRKIAVVEFERRVAGQNAVKKSWGASRHSQARSARSRAAVGEACTIHTVL